MSAKALKVLAAVLLAILVIATPIIVVYQLIKLKAGIDALERRQRELEHNIEDNGPKNWTGYFLEEK